jgi:hypothetical protein
MNYFHHENHTFKMLHLLKHNIILLEDLFSNVSYNYYD